MRRMRTRLANLVSKLTLAVAAALLFSLTPAAHANSLPATLAQPVEIAPPVSPAPEPAAADFSDADFTAADQPELGAKTGGASRLTQEEWILIIGGVLLLLIILIIIF